MLQALLEEMMTNIAEIVPKEHGRKVLHYLMSPRDTVYFHPALVATLAEGDGNATRSAGVTGQVTKPPWGGGGTVMRCSYGGGGV